jgi:hypothetical protein
MSPLRNPGGRPPLARWRDASRRSPEDPAAASAEDRASALFRRATLPGPPPLAQVERLRRRLAASLPRIGPEEAPRGGPAAPRRWRWVVAVAVLGFGTAAVAAYATGRLRSPPPSPPGLVEELAPDPAPPGARPVDPTPQPPKPARESRPRPTWSEETRRLFAATARLRRQGDAPGALAEIEAYLRRFPGGVLTTEAQVLRIDALLALGRRADARSALERLDLTGHPRRLELHRRTAPPPRPGP